MILKPQQHDRTWALIIYEAVKEKYPDATIENVEGLVAESLYEFQSIKLDDSAVCRSRYPLDLGSDVRNQVLTFLLIENSHYCSAFTSEPLVFLQSCLKGPTGRAARKGLKVADFGGEVPTPAKEAVFRFDEMQRLVIMLASSSMTEKSEFHFRSMAYVFSGIIRIHFFADGNGRTARMALQYLAKCWRLPYIMVPKVRNDAIWKVALTQAMEGNLNRLANEISNRQVF